MFREITTKVQFSVTAILGALFVIVPTLPDRCLGQTPDSSPAEATEPAPKIPNDQLDSLVAPIALYPDPLLAQMLAASTYPLEIIQLEQWLKRNGNLKQDAMAKEVAKQPWDPSVQALAIYPEVVTRLSENVAWTTDLGNAFLAQSSDVMAAIQRMRAKAKSKGTLKSGEQQTVETETAEGGGEVITIEPTNPQYAYVPSYDMEVVYGPPYYPYPPYYYPGYAPGMGLAFGTGIILGAWWANNWGDCDWGHGDLKVNHHNNFNKNNINNINGGNRDQAGGKWQHNPSHRGGAPYGDRNTAGKYGGRARQQPAGGAGNRVGGGSLGNRPGGASGIASGSRPGTGSGASGRGGIGPNRADGSNVFSGGNRGGGDGGRGNSAGRDAFSKNVFGDSAGGGNRPDRGSGAGGNRPGGSVSTMPANRGGGGTQRIGERGVSSGGGFGSGNNTFGGGGFGGSSARSASSRGGYSMGGGGFSGGGGGFSGGGGGMRGGGGGGRRR